MKKIMRFLFNPSIRFSYLARLGLLNWKSDKAYLEREFYLRFGKKLDLDNPETFNEKMQWLKLNDRKDIYTTMVDKYKVKNYVADRIGKQYIIPTLGVYDKFGDIDFSKLPEQFVVKCTHDSGGLVICTDKCRFNKEKTRKTINKFLRRRYFYIHREWPYKNVQPRIIVEKYIMNKNGEGLIDYKVMCFNGKAKMIFTCTDRFTDGLKVTFFDLDWNKMPFERHYPSSNKRIERPKNLEEMISLSEKLSNGIPFVRIDWYEVDGKLYFGEYTFYPGGGLEEFSPERWDKKIGDLIDLGLVKNEK